MWRASHGGPSTTENAPSSTAERRRDKEVHKRHLATLCQACPEIARQIADNLVELNGIPGDSDSFNLLHGLIKRQSYRLAYWRVASDEINYRRFFDINDLAALRMEDPAVFEATHEAMGHIGALIMLMALTVSVGGLIERSDIMHSVPADMGSPLIAISILLVLLVFVGMVMDPFGAVILVTATIAPVAYSNGIDPVHFWMIVLAAFELGYLSPPVALNQLLARQVVGEKEMDEADAEVRHLGFYFRYERWILPLLVMAPTLLIVAYAPYLFGLFGWY